MNFGKIALTEQDRAFIAERQQFLDEHVTEAVRQHEHDTGDGFSEPVHLALGARGWLEPEMAGGDRHGVTPVQGRLWHLMRRRAGVPWITWGTTQLVTGAVRASASPDLWQELFPRIASGEVRFCLGYTEPEGGSDIAAVKTRAVRDGDSWLINGQKIFTTGAHNCQYVFLLTRTDPDVPKHRGLTMFLVPLDSAGIEIQGLRTVDGDRTNIVFYSDVRVPDRYRLGDVNGGWGVLNDPLKVEHGDGIADLQGLGDIAVMSVHGMQMAETLARVIADCAATDSDDHRPLDDDSVKYRLGRSAARIEAAISTPGLFGRVAVAQAMRETTPDFLDVCAERGVLTDDGAGGNAEHLYRYAPLTGIYGGTVEVFRNMIAQHVLGLPRARYAVTA